MNESNKRATWVRRASGRKDLVRRAKDGADVIGSVSYKGSRLYAWTAMPADNAHIQGTSESSYAAQRALRKALKDYAAGGAGF